MASSEEATGKKGSRLLSVTLAVAGGVAVVWWILSMLPTPQLGADEEVFKAVDALFTAVTARDEKLLGRCEQRLRGLRDGKQLPAAAADHLDGILEQARAADWQAAAERLYAFISAQRREETR